MKFNSTNAPAAMIDIKKFEQARGITLPEDYVEFLLDTNGGQLNPSQTYADIPGWNSLEVQELYGLTDKTSSSIASDRFTNFSENIDKMMLNIGYDPFGRKLFMDLRKGSNYGKIYIRDHNSPPNDQILIDQAGFEDEDDFEEAQLFHLIADNFSEFTAMFGSAPD